VAPGPSGNARRRTVLHGWRDVLDNRLFLLFALAYSGQLVAYNQLYLLLPLEVERARGHRRRWAGCSPCPPYSSSPAS
jgi:hypothetical protein